MLATTSLLAAILLMAAWVSRHLASPGAIFRILDEQMPRSLHARPTPRTGGVAILGGIALGLVLLGAAERTGWATPALERAAGELASPDYLPVLAALVVLGAISLWDDRRRVPWAVRLSAQVILAAILLLNGNFTISSFHLPYIGTVRTGAFGVPFTLLFIVWMTNLYNFMDGMDGFAGGMTLIGFGFLGYLFLGYGVLGLSLLAWFVAASAGGFLVYNYPPARIFMGDVGAVPLGFLVAAIIIKAHCNHALNVEAPLMVFSPFIVDATVVILRRAMRGAKIWEPHREHYYQRLVLAGWTHRRTVGVEYLLMLASGLVAVVYEQSGDRERAMILILISIGYALLASGVRAIEARARRQEERVV